MSKTIVTPLLSDLGSLETEDQLLDQVATSQCESYSNSAANPSPSIKTDKSEQEKIEAFQENDSDNFKRASDDSLLKEKVIKNADKTWKNQYKLILADENRQISLETTDSILIVAPITPVNTTILETNREADLYEISPDSITTINVIEPLTTETVTADSPSLEIEDSVEIVSVIEVSSEEPTEPEPSSIPPQPTTINPDYEVPSVIINEPTNSNRLSQSVADKNSANSLIRDCWMPVLEVIEPLPSNSNLVVTQATKVDSAQAGQIISLSWTVQNQGIETTNSNAWQDEIYFSRDKILGNEDDVYLSSFYYPSFGLAINDSYTATQDIYLSNSALGDGYLLIKTDAYNNQLETDETDNIQAIAINITAPQDNLVVTEVITPETAQAGQKITLSWTVQNQGQEATTGVST